MEEKQENDDVFKVFKSLKVEDIERFEKSFGIPGENWALLLGDQITAEEIRKMKEEGYVLYIRVKKEK